MNNQCRVTIRIFQIRKMGKKNTADNCELVIWGTSTGLTAAAPVGLIVFGISGWDTISNVGLRVVDGMKWRLEGLL